MNNLFGGKRKGTNQILIPVLHLADPRISASQNSQQHRSVRPNLAPDLPNGKMKAAVNTNYSNIKNLRMTAGDLEKALDMMETTGKNTAMAKVNDKMTDMNDQFLVLQKTVNGLGSPYRRVSNVLKTRHDTGKNSIGNIR